MHYSWNKYLLATCTLILLTSCDWYNQQEDDPTKDLFRSDGIPYTLIFTPELTGSIERNIKKSSKLLRLAINQPSTKSALLKRAEKDKETFNTILHLEGYFEGTVDFRIYDKTDETPKSHSNDKDDSEELTDQNKNTTIVDFKVITGPQYTIGGITIHTDETSDFQEKQTLRLTEDIVGLKVGEPVELEKLETAKKKIKLYFLEKGYPFVEVSTAQGTINNEQKTLYVTFPISIKRYAIIAGTKIEGLKHISQSYVENRITWKVGTPYNEKEVKRTQNKLISSSIMSNFHVTPTPIENSPDETSKTQPIMMEVKVSEARPRVIGAGAKYSTAAEGVGGRVFWQDYNVFGNGEHLGASLTSSKREQQGKLSFDIPDVGGAENVISFQTIWLRQKTRAYSGRTLTSGASYDIPFYDNFHTSIGILNDASRLYAQNTFFNSHLTGIPVVVKVDTSDNFLDPSQGVRLGVSSTPYWGKFGSSNGKLTSLQGNIQFYIPLKQNELGEGHFVLAGYAKVGTLFINDFKKTPPNKRFYGGGSTSIRAYSYQLIGPLDSNNVPLGGRSMAEWGTEIRMRATESIGLATFFETAAITTKRSPEFGTKNMFYGGGVGIRYFSSFGPIRFDLAFPFKRRKGLNGKYIDSFYQFYISVGQAF